MQKDTRNLSVALDHLGVALEEITRAQGQAEQSLAQASAGQALSHLDLIVRRLEQERGQVARTELEAAVEGAYAAARLAWQGVHDALNDWPNRAALSLDGVRNHLLIAIEALTEACGEAPREAMRA